MKFIVKLANVGEEPPMPWWEHHDDPNVRSHRDASAYAKVLVEYWNSDLRNGELPRKVLMAYVTGPSDKLPSPPTTLMNRSRSVQ